MGITRDIFSYLIQESKRRPFSGNLLTLGRQEAKEDVPYLTNEIGALESFENIEPHKLADYIFQHLGFQDIKSLDISDYEGADLLFDLNERLPASLNDSFDVILNSGTLEHVFHIPNALSNLTRICKNGGRIIHCIPASGFIDHGYYMFSPTLLLEYYTQAKFIIDTLLLVKYNKTRQQYITVRDYLSGPDQASTNPDKKYGIFCVVTKTDKSIENIIIQQGSYQSQWKISKNIQ